MTIAPRDFFSALSHETRLRCLILLVRHPELCVCEFTHALGAVQPHVSRHLAQLRELAVVRDRRDGLWIHYRLNEELPTWALAVLRETAAAVRETSPFMEDERDLAKMPNRPTALRCA